MFAVSLQNLQQSLFCMLCSHICFLLLLQWALKMSSHKTPWFVMSSIWLVSQSIPAIKIQRGNLRHIISNKDYKFPGFFANPLSPFKMSSRIVEDENVYFHQEIFKIFIQFNFNHREKTLLYHNSWCQTLLILIF